MQLNGTLLVCFANEEAGAPRSATSTGEGSCSTHHRQCSLRWTPALQNSSHWCGPWRSASSEVSPRSTASAGCLLTWKQYLKLQCCRMAGNPCLKHCSQTPYLQCYVGSLSALAEIYPTFNHLQPSLSLGKYLFFLKACQNVWIKYFLTVLLFLSPINCWVLHWTVQPVGHHCLLQILADLGHDFFFQLLQHRGSLFLPACLLKFSFMSLQNSRQSPPLWLPWKHDVLLLPNTKQQHIESYGGSALLLALNSCGFLLCNWDCLDINLKLSLFSPWQQS